MNVFVIEQLFFELLRVAIKVQNTLSRIPSAEEWDKLYRMSKKQSLVGISFAGIQRVVEYEKIPLRYARIAIFHMDGYGG